jgi:Mg-chelatase subunit ChlD
MVGLTIAFVLDGRQVFAQSGRLEPAERPRLVNCQPSLSQPVFRVRYNLVDNNGAPLPADFGSQQLRDQLKLTIDERDTAPFHVSTQAPDTQSNRARIAVVLVDVSGSMTRRLASGVSRFEAVQAALQQFVQTFDEKSDQVAIVPFESHNVVSRIRSAVFAATKDDVIRQISALPAPQTTGNTAIYSSVVAGVELLTERLRQASTTGEQSAPETLLVIMTDGRNEVLAGDDPGLLDGPAGLARAAEAVKASGVQVIGIGFGDPGSVDQAALGQIATRSFMATDSERLRQAFVTAHRLLTDRISATFPSPLSDRASLQGRTLQIRASLQTNSGQRFTGPDQIWSAPQMGVPTYDDRCNPEELRAAIRPDLETGSRLLSIARPFLVFAGIGTLLLVLWFWVPRLVWHEQYIGQLPTPSRGRWAEVTEAARADARPRPGQPAPPGFQDGKGSQPPRGAFDQTVVFPKGADVTRTRLQRSPPDRSRS